MIESCWERVTDSELSQGDYRPDTAVPLLTDRPTVSQLEERKTEAGKVEIHVRDLITVSQTCDLRNGKLRYIALCPIQLVDSWEAEQPSFKTKGVWKEVAAGRREGIHLIGSCANPNELRTALVVDFREVISLPLGYLRLSVSAMATRFRLRSPHLEHFSQAFGRFYMRVALPKFLPDR